MRSMAKQGTGIIMSSHILDNVDQLSDKILFIKDKGLVLFDPSAPAAPASTASPLSSASASTAASPAHAAPRAGAHFASDPACASKAIDIYNELYL